MPRAKRRVVIHDVPAPKDEFARTVRALMAEVINRDRRRPSKRVAPPPAPAPAADERRAAVDAARRAQALGAWPAVLTDEELQAAEQAAWRPQSRKSRIDFNVFERRSWP